MMNTESDSKCNLLANKINSLLYNGIALSRDALHYIDSTLGFLALEELEEILADQKNCERDSLLDLIFYPDEKIQMQFEDILESGKFQKGDEEKIVAYLSALKPETVVQFSGGKDFLKLSIPHTIIENFIRRLNIYQKTDSRILEAVDTNVRAGDTTCVKVKLRNRRFDETENRINFLCMFFKSNLSKCSDFFECLDFMIEFFNEVKEDTDIFNGLSQKKIFLSNSIKKSEKIAKQLKERNFEILMMQNIRIASINIAEYQNKIEILDLICMSVFGKIKFF